VIVSDSDSDSDSYHSGRGEKYVWGCGAVEVEMRNLLG